jgi:hypothetical protein
MDILSTLYAIIIKVFRILKTGFSIVSGECKNVLGTGMKSVPSLAEPKK